MAPRSIKQSLLDETGIEPVSRRRTVQEVVYQSLGQALMTGRFKPGQLLTIASLSELFHTSHMPVREALRRLAAENALETASNGSAYVPKVTRERLDDLCNARVIVETATVADAVNNMTPRIIRSIENLAEDHLDAGREKNIPLMLAKNRDFHFLVYETAQSPVLLQLIDTLWLRFGPYLRMLTNHLEPELEAGHFEPYGTHHQSLIQALKDKDIAEAQRQIEADIRDTQTLLQPLCLAQPAIG